MKVWKFIVGIFFGFLFMVFACCLAIYDMLKTYPDYEISSSWAIVCLGGAIVFGLLTAKE